PYLGYRVVGALRRWQDILRANQVSPVTVHWDAGRAAKKILTMSEDEEQQTRQYLLARFWEAALGFWRNGGGRTAWLLTFTVLMIALVNLSRQYRLSVWHGGMFAPLDERGR